MAGKTHKIQENKPRPNNNGLKKPDHNNQAIARNTRRKKTLNSLFLLSKVNCSSTILRNLFCAIEPSIAKVANDPKTWVRPSSNQQRLNYLGWLKCSALELRFYLRFRKAMWWNCLIPIFRRLLIEYPLFDGWIDGKCNLAGYANLHKGKLIGLAEHGQLIRFLLWVFRLHSLTYRNLCDSNTVIR